MTYKDKESYGSSPPLTHIWTCTPVDCATACSILGVSYIHVISDVCEFLDVHANIDIYIRTHAPVDEIPAAVSALLYIHVISDVCKFVDVDANVDT